MKKRTQNRIEFNISEEEKELLGCFKCDTTIIIEPGLTLRKIKTFQKKIGMIKRLV